MIFGERAGNFRERRRDLIRLGRQNQHVRGLRDFQVGGSGFGAGFGGKMFSRGVKRVGGDDFARLDEPGVDENLWQARWPSCPRRENRF